jgi:hypothetical protein
LHIPEKTEGGESMKKYMLPVLVSGLVFVSGTTAVLAFHCPKLVAECQAVVAKAETRAGTDMSKLAEAKQGCADALTLHEQGKHRDAIIKAGESIALAGEATK